MSTDTRRKWRVICWGTGLVGRQAIEGVLTHPELELVGLYVARPENAGRDAGEIAGAGPCGVKASVSLDEILALEADCVLHLARASRDIAPQIEEVCRILESGKSVITTCASALIYPSSLGADTVRQIEDACRRGNAAFHSTGLEPGFACDVIPITFSGIARKVTKFTIQEILDYSTYDNAQMIFGMMGFGSDPNAPAPEGRNAGILRSFKAPAMMIADALGGTVDDFRVHFEQLPATRDVSISSGTVAKGTVAAQRFGVTAVIDGRDAIVIEHITRLGEDQAPDWPTGKGYRVHVEGEPSIRLEMEIGVNGEDENQQACLATAMHAVNAVSSLCAGEPGIKSFLDLPMILGKGAFSRR